MAYINGKHCCNCQFWQGPRKVGAFKDKAEISKMKDVGTCANTKCIPKCKTRKADEGTTCRHFEKWDRLR